MRHALLKVAATEDGSFSVFNSPNCPNQTKRVIARPEVSV